MTDAEKCRAIAMWLEPMPTTTEWRSVWSKAWKWLPNIQIVGCQNWVGYCEVEVDNGSWQPADYLHDESANARVLDAMPEPDLYVESSKGQPKVWGCNPDIMQEGPDKNPGYAFAMHADRKTAIVDAALQLIAAEKRKA